MKAAVERGVGGYDFTIILLLEELTVLTEIGLFISGRGVPFDDDMMHRLAVCVQWVDDIGWDGPNDQIVTDTSFLQRTSD